jgi:MraZ protein
MAPPLVGTFPHTLDPKGRLVLPAKFRAHFADTLYVSPSRGCLALWSPAEFEQQLTRLTEAARAENMSSVAWRALAARSEEVRPDAQGRILLPAKLRSMAGLEREVVVTGAVNRIEVWNAETWQAMEPELDAAVSEGLAGRFGV